MRAIWLILLGAAPLPAFAAPSLTLSGSCPGTVQVVMTGFTPGGRVAVLLGDDVGATAIPVGVCTGTELDLQAPSLLRVLTADPLGQASLSGQPPAARCGAVVQAVDLTTCAVSPVRSVTPGANVPPLVGMVWLSPEPAYTQSTLTCTPTDVVDFDGDPVAFSYAWSVDGALAGMGATLAGTAFSRGDAVICTVTPFDGQASGPPVSSDPLVISNSPPTITSAAISPPSPTTADTLTCSHAGFADADGDPDLSTVAWSVGGVTISTAATLSAAAYGGQTVSCTVTPDDGESQGASRSAQVTVAAPRGPLSNRPTGWQTGCGSYGSNMGLVTGTTAFYVAFQLTAPKTVDAIGFETAIGNAVTATVHGALFADAGGPGARVAQGSGSFTVGGPVTTHEIGLPPTPLAAGTWWIGITATGGTFIPTCTGLGTEPFYYSLESVGTTFSFGSPPAVVGPFDSSANRWGIVYVHPVGT